ncbi:MAG: hypothetical protein D6736_13070 [Nitrospinota bacterium]|nr:MAG: hypothetical protein D6736_13070 [Nitrospinota bacterium]
MSNEPQRTRRSQRILLRVLCGKVQMEPQPGPGQRRREKIMAEEKRAKLYLAGPEVFLPDAVEKAREQQALCARYGFIGLHPIDNNIDVQERDPTQILEIYRAIRLFRGDVHALLVRFSTDALLSALKIYMGDIHQIYQCDIVVANCNPFRGALIDDGTAYELGFGNALGKPSYGYIDQMIPAVENIVKRYPCTIREDGVPVDQDGYLVVDDFGTAINLMMQCGMLMSGGRLIEGNFEHCLQAIRADLDSGTLRLPREAADR